MLMRIYWRVCIYFLKLTVDVHLLEGVHSLEAVHLLEEIWYVRNIHLYTI